MSKPVLAYVDHSYHRLTASTAFLSDLLKQHFDVSVVWDESWKPGGMPLSASAINVLRPEVVVFFELLPRRAELHRVECRNLFWVPMRNGIELRPRRWRWLRRYGIRLLNFCEECHEFFQALGFASHYVQYWPTPSPPATFATPAEEPLRLFHWPRRGEVSWTVVKSLLGATRPEKVVFRTATDPPGHVVVLPDAADVRDYRIEFVPDWLDRSRHLELLSSCNTVIAPRTLEGIGMTFLEAMALGKAVVAANGATMNEYIRPGRNGYLFDPARPAAIDFSGLAQVRQQAAIDVAAGHQQWLASEPDLRAFFEAAPPLRRSWLERLRSRLRHPEPARD